MIRHTARLPHGYEVEFSWAPGTMNVAWSPDVPRIRSRRAWNKFRAAYNTARREFSELVANSIGGRGTIAIVDIDGPIEVVEPPVRH